MHLFRVSDRDLIRTLDAHISFTKTVAFSPDGRILASGADGGGRKYGGRSNYGAFLMECCSALCWVMRTA